MDQFEFYLGKKDVGYTSGLGYDVVMRLTAYLVHTFRRIFVDNFFTSVRLALEIGIVHMRDKKQQERFSQGSQKCQEATGKVFPGISRTSN